MIGKIGNILNGAQDAVVQSIKHTQGLVDKVQLRLASGKDVNSAIDNPSNFFLSLALSQKAGDLERLLDGIALNIQTIKGTIEGTDAILKIIDQAEALLADAETELYSGSLTSLVSSLGPTEIAAILAANPGVSYSAASQSFYQLGAPTNWTAANISAQSATLVEPSGVTGVAGVTGHLANITSLTENSFVDALAPGNAWLGGSDATVEGEWRWISGPEAGQQFWQGLAGGSTVGGSFARWGGGEPNNSGNEDTVHMRADGFWNDQPGATNYNYVIEWDSSLFVSENDPDLAARAAEYTEQYLLILDQIDLLAKDTQYRGIRLLKEDDLTTYFNAKRSSLLITEGMDGTSLGLGLATSNFLHLNTLKLAQVEVREARDIMRSYSGRLANDFSIISIRLDFTRETINVHKAGATDLVIADQNETGAELLALQVRQQLGTQALRMASQSAAAVNRLFS